MRSSSDRYIPKVSFRTLPRAKESTRLRRLKQLFVLVREEVYRLGPIVDRYRRFRELQVDLRLEFQSLRDEGWNEAVERNVRGGEEFWRSVKRLWGGQETKETKYLRDHDNNPVHDPEGKEELFRRHCSRVFRISEEDNRNFDRDSEDLVENRLREFEDWLRPVVGLDRIGDFVSVRDLRDVIRSFRQRAPGADGITKYQLERLPDVIMRNLATIYNSAMQIGYFPTQWKESIMIFLPKPGKSPQQHVNYRPISLLPLPAKVLEKVINKHLVCYR